MFGTSYCIPVLMIAIIEIAYVNVQDYAWVKRGMIFPFVDYVDRCVILVFVVYNLN